ncbi:class I tRNA ligase family protein, partial [Candidatus Bathyarchaeota archaeon]|nr:class I tRNA ligase family protein [Candidatus Bathyarchaeota archaeon]
LTFINRQFESTIPQPSNLDYKDKAILKQAQEIIDKTAQSLEKFKLQDALRIAMSLSHLGNRYFNDKEPWKSIKKNTKDAANTLYIAALLVKQLAIIMEPFIPFTAEKLWILLNLDGSVHEQSWEDIEKKFSSGHKINNSKPLFTKIEESEEELQAKLEKLRINRKKI